MSVTPRPPAPRAPGATAAELRPLSSRRGRVAPLLGLVLKGAKPPARTPAAPRSLLCIRQAPRKPQQSPRRGRRFRHPPSARTIVPEPPPPLFPHGENPFAPLSLPVMSISRFMASWGRVACAASFRPPAMVTVASAAPSRRLLGLDGFARTPATPRCSRFFEPWPVGP